MRKVSDLRDRFRAVRVYAVVTERLCRRPWRETVEALLAGGAGAVQLREKALPDGELIARARALRWLTAEAGALLIVNDRPDVALLSGADGVHLGQEDMPPAAVRELAGPDLMIGLSTHSAEQARAVAEGPVDYIGVGPVYPTDTKDVGFGGGLDMVREVCAAVELPAVAIGGITLDNAGAAIEAGAASVAAISALCGASDVEAATRAMLSAVARALRCRGGT